MASDSTTLVVPTALRDRLARLKSHPRQPYHEVISAALDDYERGRPGGAGRKKA